MKKLRRGFFLLFLFFWLVGCQQSSAGNSTPAPQAVVRPGTVAESSTLVSDVKAVAQAYLDAWKAEEYPKMYELLTSVSQDAISEEEFARHYQGVATEAALSSVDYDIQSALVSGSENAQVSYQVTLHSVVVGDIHRDTLMNLRLEQGKWRIEWSDTLVLPELAGGNYLSMNLDIPARANIYDRNGHALVAQADATAIGLYPDQIDPKQEQKLFTWLENLTGLRGETIKAMYANYPVGAGWYLPLGEVSAEKIAQNYNELSQLSGLKMTPYKARYYFDGGVAPHVVGYVSAIQPDEVDAYRRMGYRQDERVGRIGLEKWGEPYLAGKRGGTLYVLNAQGQPVTRLAESKAQPSQAIYTTLDRDFQEEVQQAMSGFPGAIVVLERDTGRVLAMVSSPGFDPNAFEPVNYNSQTLLSELANEDRPLFNRATQGQYPLGSVFKTVTMAAALESGLYAPDTTYMCGYVFNELPGVPRYDWTYNSYPPSGLLTLQGGLIRSCNPYFWHIGLDLYDQGMTKAISDMARSFGLGSPTGIEGVDEAAGQVPDPANQVDAINLAIGQGALLVTPLQVADYIAAIGNGGTLYRPQVVEKVAPPDGNPTHTFKPEIRGTLPVKPEDLKAIQEAMVGVVSSTDPRGTAYHIFTGLDIPVAGKTGTADAGTGLPHAWFAGYTFAGREDKPDIAIAVVLEHMGEGSVYAAPIFRRIVELYFRGSPGKLYPWESTYNVTRTATPQVEETPTPAVTPTSP